MPADGAIAARLGLPPVIGHRGAAAYAPENTLAGFRAAKGLGCRWVEFDVRLTADGAAVVCHDDLLERTTGARDRISRLPLAAVRQADAGRWFGVQFAGERVPTLAEALSLCAELGLGANVEIKAARGRGALTAAAVAACIVGRPPQALLLSSFLAEAVREAAVSAPHIPRGMLWRSIPRGWEKIADRLGCTTVNAEQSRLDEATVTRVRSGGYPLLAYTVNAAERARQLFDWGVASVFSDAPDIIAVEGAAVGRPGARC